MSCTSPTAFRSRSLSRSCRYRQDPVGQERLGGHRRPVDPTQCYEGLDEAKALYEWNYKKQLLRIQAEGGSDEDWTDLSDDIFSDEFLLTRRSSRRFVRRSQSLLIDEVDRVEVETEALLLEILSDYQVSIPELGTIEAKQVPLVFLTSNNRVSSPRR